MTLQNLETVLLVIPVSPIASTRSSTCRVDTPPIYASCITATKAFSDVRRGARKPGKYDPERSFGTYPSDRTTGLTIQSALVM